MVDNKSTEGRKGALAKVVTFLTAHRRDIEAASKFAGGALAVISGIWSALQFVSEGYLRKSENEFKKFGPVAATRGLELALK